MLNYSKLTDAAFLLLSRLFEVRGKAFLPLFWRYELTYNNTLAAAKRNKVQVELTKEDWYNITTQIPFYSTVTFAGGEPLVREDFDEILRDVSKKTFGRIKLETNAVLMNEKIINTLIDTKLKLLTVKMDGWGENYDKIARKKGNFKETIKNLNTLCSQCVAQKADMTVEIKTKILKSNLDDIVHIFEYATNKGFDYFTLCFDKNHRLQSGANLKDTFGREFYSQNYPFSPAFDMEKFEAVQNELNKIKKYSKTKIRILPDFETIKADFHPDKFSPCIYPLVSATINPSGDIYPCLSYNMGNVKEKSLMEIINSKNYRIFRKHLKNRKLMSACALCERLRKKEN